MAISWPSTLGDADLEGLSEMEKQNVRRVAQKMRCLLFEHLSAAPSWMISLLRSESAHSSIPIPPLTRSFLDEFPDPKRQPRQRPSTGGSQSVSTAKFVDYSGRKIGAWTIIRPLWDPHKHPESVDVRSPDRGKWLVRCDCGRTFKRNIDRIVHGVNRCCFECSIKQRREERTRELKMARRRRSVVPF